VTVVLPHPDGFDGPPAGRAADGTPSLGVRVPAWPPLARAMARLPWPLVASSANIGGAPPARRLADVAPAVVAACDLLLDGGEVGGIASTVVDLAGYAFGGAWRLLREGALGRAELVAALGPPAPSACS
jgi:tRNA A37 threonylcarbamoyladenosine synthetase subunit TsaC/SUA5/YrdC